MFLDAGWPWTGPALRHPQLEIIRGRSGGHGMRTPLVLVHGAFTAAWCWEPGFLPYFSGRGHRVVAPSLRGHGGSAGNLHTSGIQDYVADVAAVIAELDQAPVLIGHSMGALVVQRYLETATARAAVLMASVPPSGLLASMLRLLHGEPALLQQLGLMQWVGAAGVDLDVIRRAVFSDRMPSAEIAEYGGRMQRESQRALWEMCMTLLPRPPRRHDIPVLVLGAAEDRLFTPFEARETARACGVTAEVVPRMAHAMMLEPGWQGVAERIERWLAAKGVA